MDLFEAFEKLYESDLYLSDIISSPETEIKELEELYRVLEKDIKDVIVKDMKEILSNETYRLSTESSYYYELDFWGTLNHGSRALAEKVCRGLQMQYEENLKDLKEQDEN